MRYAFVEFKHSRDCREAYHQLYRAHINGQQVIVDYERARVMTGWVPRRLGGGFGGKKESGQLRFGSRDRPFREATYEAHTTRQLNAVHAMADAVVASRSLCRVKQEHSAAARRADPAGAAVRRLLAGRAGRCS